MTAKAEATEANGEIWTDDRLGRKEDAAFIRAFLQGRIAEREEAGKERSYVLNLDAGWGHGKTFFLEHFAAQASKEGHVVAYVNAWRDDFAEDPLVAVMSAIDAAVAPHIPKTGALANAYKAVKQDFGGILLAAGKGAAGQLTKKLIGEGAEYIAKVVGDPTPAEAGSEKSTTESAIEEAGNKAIREISDRIAKKAIDDFSAAKRSVDTFKRGLEDVLARLEASNVPMPLYVLVDELDRCRPPFAVAMLERVKHLFEADNVVFIVATNTEQLQHSVSAIYGATFNSEGYLNRFFDRTYRFAQPDTSDFVANLVAQFPFDPAKVALQGANLQSFITDTFEEFSIGLREMEQAYDLLRSVVTVWNRRVPIELPAMLPLVVGQVTHVRPTFGDGFAETLLSKRPPQWREKAAMGVRLYDRRNDEFSGREVFVKPSELFLAFKFYVYSPLKKIFEHRPGGLANEYAFDRLSFEFNQLHGNVSSAAGPFSIIQQYPGIVEQAGRLTQD